MWGKQAVIFMKILEHSDSIPFFIIRDLQALVCLDVISST